MYQIPKLLKFQELVHGFSTKSDGNLSFRFGEEQEVIKNRENFLSKLNIDINSCAALWVQHKDGIVVAKRGLAGKGMEEKEFAVRADGLITSEKGLYLFLLIADCLPIILYDPKEKVVGVVHAGWRNTDKKIAFKAVDKVANEFGCTPRDIYAAIGPAIHKESYKFKEPLQKQSADWKPFLRNLSNGVTSVDLIGYNKKQMEEAGVLSKNIFVSDIDTAKDPNFFSHYCDSRKFGGDQGRFACVVGLKTG